MPLYNPPASGGSITVTKQLALPAYPSTYALASASAMSSNTTGYTSKFFLPFGMTVNKVSFGDNNTVGAAGDIKFGIYSEDGQTRYCNETINISGTGLKTHTFGASFALAAGNYYVVIVPVSTTSITPRGYQITATVGTNLNNISGEPVVLGTLTVSAGTLPTTFNPSSDLTSDVAKILPYLLFD